MKILFKKIAILSALLTTTQAMEEKDLSAMNSSYGIHVLNSKQIQKFLGGKLIYTPENGTSIESKIAELSYPLEGEFNLEGIGDICQLQIDEKNEESMQALKSRIDALLMERIHAIWETYNADTLLNLTIGEVLSVMTEEALSIRTGYPTQERLTREDKLQIWLAPRFATETDEDASHSTNESTTVPVDIFWTWGTSENLNMKDPKTYDHLASDLDAITNKSLHDLYLESPCAFPRFAIFLPILEKFGRRLSFSFEG